MEYEGGILKKARDIWQRFKGGIPTQPPAEALFPLRPDRYRHNFLRTEEEGMLHFGESDGSATLDDVTSLLDTLRKQPQADRYLEYPFSTIEEDLQTALLRNVAVRAATVNWLTDLHSKLVRHLDSVLESAEEFEEEQGETDYELRGKATEFNRQIKATNNTLRLLSGTDQNLL